MTRPGERLRRVAVRVFDAKTMSRLIDPIVADLQAEYGEAVRQNRPWRAHWIRLVYVLGLVKALGLHVSNSAVRGGTNEDRRALMRMVLISAATAVAVVGLVMANPFFTRINAGVPAALHVYLIPQALPIALAVAVTMGVLLGLGRFAVSRRLAGATVVFTLGVSLASFVIGAWIIPASNQAYRVHTYRFVAGETAPASFTPPRGLAELRLGELAQERDRSLSRGWPADSFSLEYHARYARGAAPLVLGVFALCLVTGRRRIGLLPATAAVYWGPFLYYCLMTIGRSTTRNGHVSPELGAWLPNVVFAVVTSAIILLRWRSTASRRAQPV